MDVCFRQRVISDVVVFGIAVKSHALLKQERGGGWGGGSDFETFYFVRHPV